MCGIAGAIDMRGTRAFPADKLASMCAALEHRGPDSKGSYEAPGIALGTRRLAIVDLAGGDQPICNETETVWVSCNGELFDYPELLRDLSARGHRLSSACDTEVWVHLYEELGLDVLAHVKGQFAVALWDTEKRTLMLARDRLGICPLYTATSDGWLLWASEIKGILASGLVSAEPDWKGVDSSLIFHGIPGERTPFKGIKLLLPGHQLVVQGQQVRIEQYWDLDFPKSGQERRGSIDSLADEFEHLFRSAVVRRLQGDVPVATYLSGGVDSSLATAIACQLRPGSITAYSMNLGQGVGLNEQVPARSVAAHLGCEHRELEVTPDLLAAAMPQAILAAECPKATPRSAAMLELARMVHGDGIKAVISGEGADEALAGYDHAKYQQVRHWTLGMSDLVFHRCFGGNIPHKADSGAFVHSSARPFGGARAGWLFLYEKNGQSRCTLYSEKMWDSLRGYNPLEDLGEWPEGLNEWHEVNQGCYIDYRTFLRSEILQIFSDHMNMQHAVESRPVFLDDDLTEFCAAINPSLKLKGTTGKWLLRRVAEKYVPEAIANRRKHAFSPRFAAPYFSPCAAPWVEQLLSPASMEATGIFNREAVISLLDVPKKRRWRWHNRFAPMAAYSAVIETQLWHHTFFGGGLCELPSWSASSPGSIESGG